MRGVATRISAQPIRPTAAWNLGLDGLDWAEDTWWSECGCSECQRAVLLYRFLWSDSQSGVSGASSFLACFGPEWETGKWGLDKPELAGPGGKDCPREGNF